MRLIQVVPYDPLWPEQYRREAELLSRVLGEELVSIHHIGSTSVADLQAKPIIDIMPVVKDIRRVDALEQGFRALGYEAMGELGIPGRRFFPKGGDNRTHHIHIFGRESREDILRHLAVRDYLRAHPGEAREYGELKAALARRFPHDNDGYCDGKDAFVKTLEKKALAWYHPGEGGIF